MSCARVLNAVGSYRQSAKMPVDLAVGLSQHQPLYQRLSVTSLKPAPRLHQLTGRHSLLHSSFPLYSSSPRPSSPRSSSPRPSSPAPSSPAPSSPASSEPRSCFRRDAGGSPSKKRVVFADAIGLALTAVRLFIAEPSAIAATLGRRSSFSQLQSQQWTSDKLQRNRLSFPRPTLTLQASLARQPDSCVQLESCTVSGHSLSGKVRVNHVSVDKAVHVRVTFDNWRSHHDIPCTFLQQQHLGGSEVDLFSFEVSLPKHKEPTERGEFFVEFCVAFTPRPGATPYWDNNGGQNYRVYVETGGSSGHQGKAFRCYPTPSQQRPPASPGVQNSADPHHLQGTLSSRVRAEWNTCK